MTQDEIIEMAQECKLIGMRPYLDGIYAEALEAFAKMVAAKAIAQRTWVGLTDEETKRLIHNFGSDPHTLLDEVDARLKARNT